MQISSIKISNILSFEYKSSIENCQDIKFYDNLSLLIGPNGSGKSNFLEILNQVFKQILFKEAILREEVIQANKENSKQLLNLALTQKNASVAHLSRNRNSSSPVRSIKLTLKLSESDFTNLQFIFDNLKDINDILSRYSQAGLSFEGAFEIEEFEKNSKISFLYTASSEEENFIRSDDSGDECLKFIQKYLEYFEFIQKTIQIANKYNGKNWPELENTFAIIGCYRSYDSFTELYPLKDDKAAEFQETITRQRQDATKSLGSTGEPVAFELVKKKLAYKYEDLIREGGLTNDAIDKKMKKEGLLFNINNFIKEPPLSLELGVSKNGSYMPKYEIYFIDLKTDTRISVTELSAGQKGMLHFIFSLYGYNLKHGLMIIDEPELHLHPQIQERYLSIIQKASVDFDLQFIIATHSPVFINTTTIDKVFRFYNNSFTEVINPDIEPEGKDLIRILNYTNSAKIFFTQKIVLVEGETDEYFFRRFYDHYTELREAADEEEEFPDISNLEFLNIHGKTSLSMWRNFLKKFKIDTYFIGDWDNIVDLGIIGKPLFNTWKQEYQDRVFPKIAAEVAGTRPSQDRASLIKALSSYIDNPTPQNLIPLQELRDYLLERYFPYNEVRQNLISTDPEGLDAIDRAIAGKYSGRNYILKLGHLEHYLGIDDKSVRGVIKFVQNDFETWKDNPTFNDRYQEILAIFKHIASH